MNDYACRCSCGENHQWSAFYVEVSEVLWFRNREHRQRYLDSRGAQFGVDVTPKPAVPVTSNYNYT